eukprot:6186072-Pleurochrysis_carterae.AAC.3
MGGASASRDGLAHRVEVGVRAEVLRHGHRHVQVEHHVPPACAWHGFNAGKVRGEHTAGISLEKAKVTPLMDRERRSGG